jgi:ElaB/YqjD/DUF883 family membrane-anchored ribosome-binding protein
MMIIRIEDGKARAAQRQARTTKNSMQSLVSISREVQSWVANHPKESLLAALSTGVLLGWFIKRR